MAVVASDTRRTRTRNSSVSSDQVITIREYLMLHFYQTLLRHATGEVTVPNRSLIVFHHRRGGAVGLIGGHITLGSWQR